MSNHLMDCVGEMPISRSKKLVLLAMADSADKLTRIAVPGLERVEKWANVGKSQALNLIAELIDEGLIIRKSAGRKGQRAEFWVLPNGCCALHGSIDIGSESSDPTETRSGSEVQDPKRTSKGSRVSDPKTISGSENPDPMTGLGSEIGSDKGSDSYRTPSVSTYLGNPSLRSGLPARDARARDAFDDFWATYPRKAGKRAAETAWDRAVKRGVKPQQILAGACRYRDDPNRVPEFTAHPSTWLNQGRWDDDPLPPRSSPRASPTQNVVGWLNVGRNQQPPDDSSMRAIEGGH